MRSFWGTSIGALLVLVISSALGCGEGQAPDGASGGATSVATTGSGPTTVGSVSHAASTTSSGSGGQGGAGGAVVDPPRADVPAIPCNDTIPDVYITPDNLPAMTDETRGVIIRCATDGGASANDVEDQVSAIGVGTPMTSGVTLYRIAFRTERGDGSAGISSARVYLPSSPRTLPLPVILIGHPTDGIADNCAPSMDPISNRDLALPWAGLGYAVIVPDYAGLGNEGAQGYLDNRDQAHSLLDGARALRKMLSPGALSSDILAVGFSQGGGAVLSAQSLAKSYGADGDLVGAIAFAPEWPTRMNSFGFVDMLENPTELTILTGVTENVVAAMRDYAYFYNYLGMSHDGDSFPSSSRSDIVGAVESLCQIPLGGYLQATAAQVGDIFDDTMRTTLLACIQGNGQGTGCTEPGKSYYDFLAGNILTADPTGAKVLFIQGLADYVMPAATEGACNVDKLIADGVTPQVCVDPVAQHQTVVALDIDFAMKWGLALLAHDTLPTCSDAGMPACNP